MATNPLSTNPLDQTRQKERGYYSMKTKIAYILTVLILLGCSESKTKTSKDSTPDDLSFPLKTKRKRPRTKPSAPKAKPLESNIKPLESNTKPLESNIKPLESNTKPRAQKWQYTIG